MRILLCDTLGENGPLNGELLAALQTSFAALGHETENVVIPYNDDARHRAGQLLAMRFMPLSDRSDVAICLSSPALLMPHPRKIIWLCREPTSLACEAVSPGWLNNALWAGYEEATANFVSTDKQKMALKAQNIEAKLLEIPPVAEPQAAPWRTVSDTLLPPPRRGHAK